MAGVVVVEVVVGAGVVLVVVVVGAAVVLVVVVVGAAVVVVVVVLVVVVVVISILESPTAIEDHKSLLLFPLKTQFIPSEETAVLELLLIPKNIFKSELNAIPDQSADVGNAD